MHQRSFSELQGFSTQLGASTQWTKQDRAFRSSRMSGASTCCGVCPPRGAPLRARWLVLLLGSLLVPGAWSFLNEEQEELLVELHNHYRGQVSPSASAMMPLVRHLQPAGHVRADLSHHTVTSAIRQKGRGPER